MAAAVSPRRLVPIHSAKPESDAGLFQNVQQVANEKWFLV